MSSVSSSTSSTSTAHTSIQSPTSFIISIDAAAHSPQSVYQIGQKPMEKVTEKRRKWKLIVALFMMALLMVGVTASLTISIWTMQRMNVYIQSNDRLEYWHDEQIARLDHELKGAKAQNEQLLKGKVAHLDETVAEMAKQLKEQYEVKMLPNHPMTESSSSLQLPNEQNNEKQQNPQRSVDEGHLPKSANNNGATDFVIYVNGKPMSGKEFMAYGPRGRRN